MLFFFSFQAWNLCNKLFLFLIWPKRFCWNCRVRFFWFFFLHLSGQCIFFLNKMWWHDICLHLSGQCIFFSIRCGDMIFVYILYHSQSVYFWIIIWINSFYMHKIKLIIAIKTLNTIPFITVAMGIV